MNLVLRRILDTGEETVGALYERDSITAKEKFLCFTLEDEARTEKIYGETRIPEGTYKVTLRDWGRFHLKYSRLKSKFHVGMLQLNEVKNFTDILVHQGNTDDDTAGCILVGSYPEEYSEGRFKIVNSTKAYDKTYVPIATEIQNGGNVFITIIDN